MRNLTLFLLVFALAGCASSAVKVSKAQKVANSKYTKNIKMKSLDQVANKKCESAKVKWSKLPWNQLLQNANRCAQDKNWKVVGSIGQHLAATEFLSPWGPFYLSVAAFGQNHKTKSLWMIDLALKKSPNLGVLHYQKGRILFEMKSYDESVAVLERSIELDSSNSEAYSFLGSIYFRDHEYKKASRYFNKSIKLNAKNYSGLVGASECLILEKDFERAIQLLIRAQRLNSRSLGVRLKLASIYEIHTKEFEKALNSYKKIKSLYARKKLDGVLNLDLNKKIQSLQSLLKAQTVENKISMTDRKSIKKKGKVTK